MENNYKPDILDCLSNLSNDEVFTPPRIVNKILDLLPEHVWYEKDYKWLDPACKSGVFLREIAKRLMISLEKQIPNESERREHIFKNMLWGIAITELTSLASRRTLYYSKDANSEFSIVKFNNPNGNIFYENIEHSFDEKNSDNQKNCIHCGCPISFVLNKKQDNNEFHAYQFIHQKTEEIIKEKKMKFDVIVTNPPYQLNTDGHGNQAKPLYHKFIEMAIEMNPRYISMITPSRWFTGGWGLKEFRENMLKDKRIKTIVDFLDEKDCFPGVEIKGGVSYFLWDQEYYGPCEFESRFKDKTKKITRDLDQYDVLIRHNEAISILEKVKQKTDLFLNSKVLGLDCFGFATNFSKFTQTKDQENNIAIYLKNKTIGYIKESVVVKNKELLDGYKVLIPKASEGKGDFPNKILGQPILTEKKSVCSMTYVVCSIFDKEEYAQNFCDFLKTKFARFMVSLRKQTQDFDRNKMAFVPDLDMSKKWTDADLYKLYNLTDDEINLINSMIKEM